MSYRKKKVKANNKKGAVNPAERSLSLSLSEKLSLLLAKKRSTFTPTCGPLFSYRARANAQGERPCTGLISVCAVEKRGHCNERARSCAGLAALFCSGLLFPLLLRRAVGRWQIGNPRGMAGRGFSIQRAPVPPLPVPVDETGEGRALIALHHRP